MPGSLEGLIASMPVYGAVRASDELNRRNQQQDLQNTGALQGILKKQQMMQEQEQMKQMLQQASAASGGDPEKMHQLLLQTGNPLGIKLAQGFEGHIDRKAKLSSENLNRQENRDQRLFELTQRGEQEIARVREAAAQQRITKEEADKREQAMREGLARLGAQLRPPPQVQPLVAIIDPATGEQRLVERKDAVGKVPAATGAKAEALAQGKSDVDLSLATLRGAYDRLEKGGGVTSTENSSLGNAGASISASGPGQFVGRVFGTQNQSARNDIRMARPALMAAVMKATGMSSRQIDSNAELKLWISTATDDQLDVESNRRALDNIERKFLGGKAPDRGPINPPVREFATEAEAIASGVKGKVKINGRNATIN